MEKLWAPWRMEFLEGEREAGCVFCNRIQSKQDRDNLIIERNQTTFSILNKYPYSNGHLMVVPYEHTDELKELTAETAAEVMATLARWSDIMRRDFKAEGFNIGANLGRAAGAGIADHLHFHLVPRWVGDTNYMPVLSDTKVISEHLTATYDRLKKAWEQS